MEVIRFLFIGLSFDVRFSCFAVYIQNGFLYLQRLVSEAIIKVWRPAARETLSKIKIMVQRMPYPPYDTNPAVDLIQNSLAMYFVISFMSYAINTTKGIVHEKERSLKVYAPRNPPIYTHTHSPISKPQPINKKPQQNNTPHTIFFK